MRGRLLLCALALLVPTAGSAQWQIKPFFGATFGGGTTFVDLDHAAGNPTPAIGISGGLLGEVAGFEADVGYAPGFFQSGDQQLVVRSGVATLTGNVVMALPRHLVLYTLRPYLLGGAGVMHVHIDDALGVLAVASNLPVVDVGGGVTGFLTDRVGLSWDVRYFRSVGGNAANGFSFGPEHLSFWRVNMAVVFRH